MIWARSIGGTGDDYSLSIDVDKYDCSYITGSYSGTVDFDPGTGVYSNTSIGISDIYVNKLDSSGEFVWSKSIGATGDARAYSIAVDSSGNIHFAGFFYGTAEFDPGSGIYTIASAGGADGFIEKLRNSNVGIAEKEDSFNVNIYPNPSAGKFHIKSETQFYTIKVNDIMGKEVFSKDKPAKEIIIDLSSNSKGAYFVKICSEAGMTVLKVLITN